MKVAETHVLAALDRARSFIDRHAAQLGTVETAGYRRELDVVIDMLEQNASGQQAARRRSVGQFARLQALYSALRLNHMGPIAAIAAAQRHALPELGAIQTASSNLTPRRLVADAEAMALVAKQHTEVFVAAGLSEDFVEQLEAAAQALAEAITERGTTIGQRTGATEALRTATSRGRHVLAVLGSMIKPQLAADPALLTEWKTARHILRPPRARPINYALLYGMPALAGVAKATPAVTSTAQPNVTAPPAALGGQTASQVDVA